MFWGHFLGKRVTTEQKPIGKQESPTYFFLGKSSSALPFIGKVLGETLPQV